MLESRLRVPSSEVLIPPAQRQASLVALFLTLLAASLFVPGSARPAPSSIGAKEAEAERVLAQIQQIDGELDLAVDAYNAAEIRLDEIKAEEAANLRRLAIARENLTSAQEALAERLVALYTSNDPSVIEVLLGATSLDELLDRLDTVSRVSAQDARIVNEVRAFRAEIRERRGELARSRTEQERVVAERAARREAIEDQIAERERLLATIKDEIAELRAAEARRQEQLEAQARQQVASSPGGGGANPGANPPPGKYGGVVGIAMQYLGIPYRWGGASPQTGFDCSGFVMYVYAQVGVSLPHNAAMQYGYGSPVSRENLQPGDLVFFNSLGHNGIYIGNNAFIHSPHTGDVVKISTITGWYASTWVGGRRL